MGSKGAILLGTSAIKYATKNHVAVLEKSFPVKFRSFFNPITAAYWKGGEWRDATMAR